MKKPIDGMAVEPFGDDILLPAWISLFIHLALDPQTWEPFYQSTGHRISDILSDTNPLMKMIDQATGYDRTIVVAFADWITINFWGRADN